LRFYQALGQARVLEELQEILVHQALQAQGLEGVVILLWEAVGQELPPWLDLCALPYQMEILVHQVLEAQVLEAQVLEAHVLEGMVILLLWEAVGQELPPWTDLWALPYQMEILVHQALEAQVLEAQVLEGMVILLWEAVGQELAVGLSPAPYQI
jgi:hypothetical protein